MPLTSVARRLLSRPCQTASQTTEANEVVPLPPLFEAEEVAWHEDFDGGKKTEVVGDNADAAGEVGVAANSAKDAEDDHEVIATTCYCRY